MKATPLQSRHEALGAKMTEFAGYLMPLVYSSIREEHLGVRDNVGIFDVSHMGEFIIKGKEALALVQKVTSNDASKLKIGEAQYSCLPNKRGGIVDDLLVYRLDEDQCAEGEQVFMLVVNAANIEKDFNWIASYNEFNTRLIDISEQTGLLAIQGPQATAFLQPFTAITLEKLTYYTFAKTTFAGCHNVLISATGYTGSGGFEIYAENKDIERIWDAIFEKYTPDEMIPAGLGARDTLRLEMGYCLYGNDIDDTTSPLEAGLGWITKIKKGPFVSKEIFAKQKAEGIVRRLVGFTIDDRRVPRHGYQIEDEAGNSIGVVTSGTFAPSLETSIGMGYVKTPFSKDGTLIYIATGRKKLKGTVTKLPFLKLNE